MFGDSRAKTNDAILKGWKNHVERLYCPSDEYSYDNQFKHEVEKTVSTYLQRTENEVPISLLSIEELTEIVRVHSILTPDNVWITAKARPETLPLMKFLARLCCS